MPDGLAITRERHHRCAMIERTVITHTLRTRLAYRRTRGNLSHGIGAHLPAMRGRCALPQHLAPRVRHSAQQACLGGPRASPNARTGHVRLRVPNLVHALTARRREQGCPHAPEVHATPGRLQEERRGTGRGHTLSVQGTHRPIGPVTFCETLLPSVLTALRLTRMPIRRRCARAPSETKARAGSFHRGT